MRQKPLLCILILFSCTLVSLNSFSNAPGQTPPPDPLPDLVEKIAPGVVNISVVSMGSAQPQSMDDFIRFWGLPAERKYASRGSGFIIDKEGYVITNNHVVNDANEVIVTLHDKREFRAKIIGKDPKLDLAVLQIRGKDLKVPEKLSVLQLGDSDAVRIAQTVIAIGNPFGLQNTVTRGIISAKHRTIGLGPFDNFLQTDASINPGNSGGPLFNLSGEVIGINSAIYSLTGQSSGLGLAIPVNEVKRVLPDLKRYGRIPRPWLGIVSEKLTPAIAAYYQLAREEGILIYNVVQSSPAAGAGVQRGDILISIEEDVTLEPNDVERALDKRKPNQKVFLNLQRGRKKLKLPITLRDLPPRLDQLPKGIL